MPTGHQKSTELKGISTFDQEIELHVLRVQLKQELSKKGDQRGRRAQRAQHLPQPGQRPGRISVLGVPQAYIETIK